MCGRKAEWSFLCDRKAVCSCMCGMKGVWSCLCDMKTVWKEDEMCGRVSTGCSPPLSSGHFAELK